MKPTVEELLTVIRAAERVLNAEDIDEPYAGWRADEATRLLRAAAGIDRPHAEFPHNK